MFCTLKGERTLYLLVENCGRVNYGKALDDQRKGRTLVWFVFTNFASVQSSLSTTTQSMSHHVLMKHLMILLKEITLLQLSYLSSYFCCKNKYSYVKYRTPNSTPLWPVWFGMFALHIFVFYCITGIVGDILLNHTPLRGFNIFCLDMKPGFLKRLVK